MAGFGGLLVSGGSGGRWGREGAGGFAPGFGGDRLIGGEVGEGAGGDRLGGGADQFGPDAGDGAEGVEPFRNPWVGKELGELEDGEPVVLAEGLGGEVFLVELLDEGGGGPGVGATREAGGVGVSGALGGGLFGLHADSVWICGDGCKGKVWIWSAGHRRGAVEGGG